MSGKISLELHEYQNFRTRFNNGEFGSKRFGQAFYDHFQLSKIADQSKVGDIYEKDDDEAKTLISQTFEFI